MKITIDKAVGIILVVLIGSGLFFSYSKQDTTLYKDGEVLGKYKWTVNAERTYINKNSWYRENVMCPRIISNGGYETDTRCYYAQDTYEQLSRSLINTELEVVDGAGVWRQTPFYKYGTRGSYAGYLSELSKFEDTDNIEDFPLSYEVIWQPKDTRRYMLEWRIWDIKTQPYEDGIYENRCKWRFGALLIEASDCIYTEIKGDSAVLMMPSKRYTQQYYPVFIDPITDIADHVIACYDFDDTTDSAGNYSLTESGGIGVVSECVQGSCYSFDGSDDFLYNNLMGPNALDGLTNLSYNVWVRSNHTTDQDSHILGTNPSGGDRFLFIYDADSGGTVRHRSKHDSNMDFESATGVLTTDWLNVGFSWSAGNNSGTATMWLDGTKTTFSSSTPQTSAMSSNDNWSIGLDDSSYFEGRIDQLVVYDTAITAEYNSLLYASGTGLTCAEILGTEPEGDTTDPTATIFLPEASTTYYNKTWVVVSGLCTDETGVDTLTLYYNSSTVVNNSPVNNTQWEYNLSGLEYSNYTLFYRCADTSANTGDSSSVWVAFINDTTPEGNETPPEVNATGNSNIIINMTFNDGSDWMKNDGIGTGAFDSQGSASYTNDSICHWYGCANLTAISGDYINSTFNISSLDYMAISYWVYYVNQPGESNPQGNYYFGSNSDQTKRNQEYSTYAFSSHWMNQSGSLIGEDTWTEGDEGRATAGTWHFIFEQYDGVNYSFWKDGNDFNEVTAQPRGPLAHNLGDRIIIGFGEQDYNFEGYIDEFVVYNRSNFTTADVEAIYQKTALGTPPTLDLVPTFAWYNTSLHKNWSHPYRYWDMTGTINMTLHITNAGDTGSTSFDWDVVYADNLSSVCSGNTTVSATSTTKVYCSLPKIEGITKFLFRVDTGNSQTEDTESNNELPLYLNLIDGPFTLGFTDTFWNTTLAPYYKDSDNDYAYQSYNRYRTFDSEDWDSGWTCNSVDPRGKKMRESAYRCLLNDFDPADSGCIRAFNHLEGGWPLFDPADCTSAQAVHEFAHVGISTNIMTRMMNQTFYEQTYNGLGAIAEEFFYDYDIETESDTIAGGNGQGFGMGMGMLAMSVMGQYPDNPFLISNLSSSVTQYNEVQEWIDRQVNYLAAMKNDSYAQYQEGWLYKLYSQYHPLDVLNFMKQWNFIDIDDYQNAMDSMAREMIYIQLDDTYNGNTLRDDESNPIRSIQRGDSNSYELYSDYAAFGYGMLTHYALLTNDTNLKGMLAYNRDKFYNDTSSGQWALSEWYSWYYALDGVSYINPDKIMDKVMYDNANDIFTIRTGYSYSNDTVIQIDGGEERGSGHSQAQGYYLYAMGEPFLDYEQVPYEDDVRAETWKNGISLQDATQTVAGQNGEYSQACGNAPKNQYYGMLDCPEATISEDYPDYRRFPLSYGGDNYNYLGTSDADVAGVKVVRPYESASPINQLFIKYGDMLVIRETVSDNVQTGEVYHNLINLHEEFTQSNSGDNITFTRGTKNLKNQLVYDSTGAGTVFGGETTITANRAKTSSSPLNTNYTRTGWTWEDQDIDIIVSHHWYTTGSESPVTAIGSSDRGVRQGNRYVLFDVDGDGNVSYLGIDVNGWGMVYDSDEIGAFNTSSINIGYQLMTSDKRYSTHFKLSSSVINMTANTAKRSIGIDYPETVRVTLDTRALTNTTGQVVYKNGVTEVTPVSTGTDTVTFDITPGLNSDYYEITADNAPPVSNSTCDCSSIQSGTTIDCSESCTVSACDASGQDITISGTGTVTISGDISNYGDVIIQGTDSTHKCNVICNGGCFT